MKLACPILAAELAEAVAGTLVNASGTEKIVSLSHDSRTLESGDWFLALRGDAVDGHDFIPKVVGKKPLAQFTPPPRGPRGPDCSTMNPGKSRDSVPRPYVTHEPMLGCPKIGRPQFISNWPGVWLDTSVCIERMRQVSSAILPRCGM